MPIPSVKAGKSEDILNEKSKTFSFGSSIAIIDDLESNRIFLEHLARRLPGVKRVDIFASAEKALTSFAEFAPDLVITDFNMPGMNGIEFLEALRRSADFEDLPVIMVSSYNETANRYRALQAGATDFLMVPFDPFEFQARTRNLLKLSVHQKHLKSQSLALRSQLLETRDESLRDRHQFTSIIDSVPAPIFAVNAAGQCVFANQFCFEFLGLANEDCQRGVQELADKVIAQEQGAGAERTLQANEVALVGQDGCEHVFLIAPKKVSDDDQERRLTVYSGIEISQLKDTERSLRKAKDEAEAANRAKSAFLSNMTHEIRTPLNAIIGFTDIMCKELHGPIANEKYKSYLFDIQSSANLLLAIINEILDFSQIEAQRHTVNLGRFSIKDCLGEIANFAKHQLTARGNWLQIQDLPDLIVHTDRQKLNQVILNIITNANKAMTGGPIRISAAYDEAGGLIITVKDNGVGMSREELALAMSEFGRVSNSAFVSDGYAGTGLGLPISIGFMALLGGRLDVESEKGVGTIVRISLPQSAIVGPRDAHANGAAARANQGEADQPGGV